MSIVVGLRLLQVEVHAVTIGLLALIPFLLLPAWVVLGWAIVARRRVHAVVACLLVVAHLGFSVGTVGWRTTPPQLPAGDIRIGSANLYAGNPTTLDVAGYFVENGVDVMLFQEVTPELAGEFATAPLYEDYPYRVLDPRPGFFGSAILSKVPLAGQVLWVDGWPMTEATINLPSGEIHLVNVHVEPPLSAEGVGRWKRQASELAELVERRSVPTLLIGDFNATDQHSTIKRLRAAGLADAHLTAGSGLGSTWPAIGPVAVLRFDRAFSTERMQPVDARLGDGFASDHRPLLVTYDVVS